MAETADEQAATRAAGRDAGTATPARGVATYAAPFLAADVGGTHARVGLVVHDSDGKRPVRVIHYHRYRGAEWPSLTALLGDFLAELADVPEAAGIRVERCVIACAGYVLDDRIVNENLPWPVSVRDIRARLRIDALEVINDFAAVAYATPWVTPAEVRPIIPAPTAPSDAPVLVMGPGTGLGSAVVLPRGGSVRVLATEAGQVSLAPGTERELDILRVLMRHRPYVSVEDALSGPGLRRLYQVIAGLDGRPTPLATPAAVSQAARERTDPAASEAVHVFCGLLGSFVGDLVLLYGARGGVYLAGGILPQILPLLLTSTFVERYFNKGVMQPYLRQVPVHLIEHGQLGVIGAALWYLGERHGG